MVAVDIFSEDEKQVKAQAVKILSEDEDQMEAQTLKILSEDEEKATEEEIFTMKLEQETMPEESPVEDSKKSDEILSVFRKLYEADVEIIDKRKNGESLWVIGGKNSALLWMSLELLEYFSFSRRERRLHNKRKRYVVFAE